jgi:sporulation protein YlmC with PRC-barrel domain
MGPNNKIITSDDILGKEAVDSDGEILGIVTKVHINKETKKLLGMTVDQGFMKPELFIGLNYIRNFGVDAVFLNKVPTDKFRGLDVFTSKGVIVGKVKDVKAKRHRVQEIIISKKGVLGKVFSIAASDIETISSSVILKERYRAEQLEK